MKAREKGSGIGGCREPHQACSMRCAVAPTYFYKVCSIQPLFIAAALKVRSTVKPHEHGRQLAAAAAGAGAAAFVGVALICRFKVLV